MIRAALRVLTRPRAQPGQLRPAAEADAAALARILSGWIESTPWMPRLHSRREDRGFVLRLIREMSVTLVQRPGTPPLGFLARREGFIHALYLAPQARRQGLGRQLLDAAKAASPALDLWSFQANAPARKFYAAQGFAEVEWTPGQGNDEGLPDVRLVWRRDGGSGS